MNLLLAHLNLSMKMNFIFFLVYVNKAPFTLRTLLCETDDLELSINKRFIPETLRFIN